MNSRSSFVGRDEQMTSLVELLHKSDRRVVTVTGPAGVGKTRLAVHAVARAAASFDAGAWLVELGSVATREAVPDVVLSALGGKRQSGRSAEAALADHTSGGGWLVLLDNCEHVLDAAAGCAEAIVSVGESTVLATSRQPLATAGEQLFPLSGLSADAAVDLFADRACAVEPGFGLDVDSRSAVTDICAQLDGLPLAIELAAARVRSMSLLELTAGVGKRFRLLRDDRRGTVGRHQTLDAAVRWSFDLLEPQQQDVFAQLCVFAGGFLSDAVCSTCGLDKFDDVDAVDVLDALVARSMVDADPRRPVTRYSLLETMREFGRGQMKIRGDAAALRDRHAQHYLAVAEAARRRLSTPEGGSAMSTMAEEWDNLRVALDWMSTTNNAASALRLVVAAFWYAHENFQQELLEWGDRALALDPARVDELWPAAAAVTSLMRRSTGDIDGPRDSRPRRCASNATAGGPAGSSRRSGVERRLDGRRLRAGARAASGLSSRRRRPRATRSSWPGRAPRACHHARRDGSRGPWVGSRRRHPRGRSRPVSHSSSPTRTPGCSRSRAHETRHSHPRCSPRPVSGLSSRAHGSCSTTPPCGWLWRVSDEEPLQTLAFLRLCVADTHSACYWGNFEMILRPVVPALVRLGRHRPAAVILGGLLGLAGGRTESIALATELRPQLTDALGDELDSLLRDGQQLDRPSLAQLTISEVDLLTSTSALAPTKFGRTTQARAPAVATPERVPQ